MELIGNHDTIVGDKLQNGSHNATYTSPEIQNAILQILGEMLRSQICKEVNNAKVFSLLVDETKDIRKIEQSAIVLRYVNIACASIHERFLTFVPAESNYILQTLEHYCTDMVS